MPDIRDRVAAHNAKFEVGSKVEFLLPQDCVLRGKVVKVNDNGSELLVRCRYGTFLVRGSTTKLL